MWLLLPLPLQASFVQEVGAQVPLQENGTFARPFFVDGELMLGFAAGQGYWMSPLERDPWALPPRDFAQRLTPESTPMRDFSMRPCPDGAWLLVGSADLYEPDDSAYAFAFDAQLNPVDSAPLALGITARSHNDMTTVCDGPLRGSFFPADDGSVRNWFVHLDGAWPDGETQVANDPRMSGGAAAWDPQAQELIALGFGDTSKLLVVRYDADLVVLQEHAVSISESPERAYWPQGLLRIEDVWVVAHMLRDEQTWAPGDEGDLALAFFDRDWQLLGTRRLTNNPLDGGGQRPWMLLDGNLLLVAYDRQQELTLIPVTLDLDAFSLTGPGDSGPGEDSGPQDTADTGLASERGCSCQTSSLSGGLGGSLLARGLLGLGLLGLLLRARQPL